VHVNHLGPGQRFVLAVPDGELEVRGTRFLTEVAENRTKRFVVTEGTVAARLSGAPERVFRAGDSWSRDSAPRADVHPEADVPLDAKETRSNVLTARDSEREKPHPLHVATEPVVRESAGSGERKRDEPPPHESHAGAAEEFSAAMAAFSSGAYLEADDRLAAFAARFPTDSRNEDAAFLRAVIAARRGDRTAAVARARDYLRRFKTGLRRPELERLLALGDQ
jgi:TolA-binding protein